MPMDILTQKIKFIFMTFSQFGDALVGQGISSIGSLVSHSSSAKTNYKYTKRLQDAQNKWNLEQWNRENAYNTPLAQVQRLQEAGINPALAFSNVDNTNSAAQSPTASEAGYEFSSPYDTGNFVQTLTSLAQKDLFEKQSQSVGLDNALKAIDVAVAKTNFDDRVKGEKGKHFADSQAGDLAFEALQNARQLNNINADNSDRLGALSEGLRGQRIQNDINEFTLKVNKMPLDQAKKASLLAVVERVYSLQQALENIRSAPYQRQLLMRQIVGQEIQNLTDKAQFQFDFRPYEMFTDDGDFKWSSFLKGVSQFATNLIKSRKK